jgi:hypothetical protein
LLRVPFSCVLTFSLQSSQLSMELDERFWFL